MAKLTFEGVKKLVEMQPEDIKEEIVVQAISVKDTTDQSKLAQRVTIS